MTSTEALKEQLRETAAKQREAIAAEVADAAGNDIGSALIATFDRSLDLPAGIVVSGYFPIGSEANVLPLLKTLSARGFRIALPVVGKRMTPLVFREWQETDTMEQGPFNIPEPKADADILRPDLILTPLLAFDTRGNRLGYGGGLYDLTIATLREYQPASHIAGNKSRMYPMMIWMSPWTGLLPKTRPFGRNEATNENTILRRRSRPVRPRSHRDPCARSS